MRDAGMRGRGDRGLGAKGDAESRCAEHRQVIGAVADRQRLRRVEAEPRAEIAQGREFGVASEDRLGDPADEKAVGDDEPVRAVLVEAQPGGDRAGELGEAARHDRGIGAVGAHARAGARRGPKTHLSGS